MSGPSLRNVISKPNGDAFKSRYLGMERKEAKKLLVADCRSLSMSVPVQGLQMIEKGMSHKCRVSHSNSEWTGTLNSSVLVREHERASNRPAALNVFERAKLKQEKKLAEQKAIKEVKRAELLAAKKQKKMEVLKDKMAEIDSWEDL